MKYLGLDLTCAVVCATVAIQIVDAFMWIGSTAAHIYLYVTGRP